MSKKKNFLERAIDLISTRDEKAALEEAQQALKRAEERAKAAEAKSTRLEAAKRKRRLDQMRRAFEERKQVLEEHQFIASHTIEEGESLSHIALHYYGSANEPFWRVIYEENKDVIGENPNHVRAGQVINVPELPEELKKK